MTGLDIVSHCKVKTREVKSGALLSFRVSVRLINQCFAALGHENRFFLRGDL